MNPQDIITNYGREVEDASYNIYQALADELNNNANYRKHFRLQLQSIENKNQEIKDFYLKKQDYLIIMKMAQQRCVAI